MQSSIERRLSRVWLLLSGITLLSWWLGLEHGARSPRLDAAVTAAALLIAALKVRVIVVEFMEARHTSPKLQRAMDLWLFLLVAGLFTIYTLGLGMPPV
jgi:hypothetical protein